MLRWSAGIEQRIIKRKKILRDYNDHSFMERLTTKQEGGGIMNIGRELPQCSRRHFMKAALGGGAMVMLGQFGILRLARAQQDGKEALSMIVVDYAKCTGCRTCETACSAFNHKHTLKGETLNGLGNPDLANIQVYGYNPDVDVPVVCAMCPGSPCIEACPVDPDAKTGRKALYRATKTQTITNDPERCIACGSCAEACRVGVIRPNAETDLPEHMCTLCGGDPQCVKHCPFGALSHVKVDPGRKFYAQRPEQIAAQLMAQWYGSAK
jgi:Fe-S-cluster-containing hydrogenase component 2